jgi:hypothetical protein
VKGLAHDHTVRWCSQACMSPELLSGCSALRSTDMAVCLPVTLILFLTPVGRALTQALGDPGLILGLIITLLWPWMSC